MVVLLGEDGTEVDDDDYFSFLPPQTVFVILKPGQKWECGMSSRALYFVLYIS